jgi:hypothetical protein
MVNTLPVERGLRGVVLKEPLKKDDAAFKIPQPCMLSTATAVRTKDLGTLIQDERLQLSDLPTVVLALHLMVEHTKALVVSAAEKGDITADIPVAVTDYAPLPAGTIIPGRTKDAHSHGHTSEHDDGEGHGTSHESHGHSHGGKACHGHGESQATATHSHSHGGKPCHGHGEAPKAAHGHSHGGKPCHGHGDHEEAGEPMIGQSLDIESHPWGSAFRAYIATLPDKPTSCLYFSGAQLTRLGGELTCSFAIAS